MDKTSEKDAVFIKIDGRWYKLKYATEIIDTSWSRDRNLEMTSS